MNNKCEMTDSELELVAGGFEGYEVVETRYNFTYGDTFKPNSGVRYYVVRENISGGRSDTLVYCQVFSEIGGLYELRGSDSCKVSNLVTDYTFIGNGIINESNIRQSTGQRAKCN